MKEVVVQNWCDGEHAMKMPATHANQEVTLRSNRRQSVDLCESCYDTMIAPLEKLVHEHGVPITSATPAGKRPQGRHGKGPHVCRTCGFGARSEGGLALHASKKHGMKLADVRQQAANL